ncbi:alanine--tRNA ligase [Thiospirillum jenense]|uniref:Alanine--tRNA ligase n=1 Tax=Thiospirillum jenense TaxID=1653858 RepID=A0A839HDQ0_9GAMM|nr:alanine--tRNA ligase [Thiospirillum jenense]MBB1125307.1 alanine--tRNA ligase [Thiospirillum jenense]
MTSSAALRHAFLDYFAQRDHTPVASSPLIPGNDPTLLFTNAGMVQFKDVFLGREQREYRRAVTAQRCVRAGGKHNDLENVGYTARHHTFFEMLGNFSFGDYFKRDAIQYAWEFLTGVLKIPAERLWVTVFIDDDEAANIWLNDIGINPACFSRCGAKDNFWAMGDTGPCGPCSEIFYDHGPAIAGGPPGSPDADGDRYVEIWNLVFMQYDRASDGRLTALPRPSVDTGMGLERLAAVMQGVHSNYDIDLFQHLITAAMEVTGCRDRTHHSLRVIADHIRSTAFLVTDGVTPSNEGRGYVQRRIIRRAIRHGYQLGQHQPFFHRLVAPLVAVMGEAYPELAARAATVEQVLRVEEERFAETLSAGLKMLDDITASCICNTIPGEVIFKLYDTYGFPVDLTADVARERGLALNLAEFDDLMAQQKARARAASQFGANQSQVLDVTGETVFCGYERTRDAATVIALYLDGVATERLVATDAADSTANALVVLDVTPFYAESGGQVGDTGQLTTATAQFSVTDTQKRGSVICHLGRVTAGELAIGDRVDAQVNNERRQATAVNHSATHLLHAALRRVLGEHVQQRGSLVNPDRLRFDFSHFEPIERGSLRTIERLVNHAIRRNYPVETQLMNINDAKAAGAMALFGEKYGNEVRVLRMGDFSIELCGGTHVHAAGDIGVFKITSEGGIASGVRRIEAVAGEAALAWIETADEQLSGIAQLVKSNVQDANDKVAQLLERARRLERELEQLKSRLAAAAGAELVDQAVTIAGIKVLASEFNTDDPKTLRDTLDQLKNKLGSGVVLLAAAQGDKVNLIAGVTADLTKQFQAGDLIKTVAHYVGGRGGGRADMAQAGGNQPAGIPAALAAVTDWVKARANAN